MTTRTVHDRRHPRCDSAALLRAFAARIRAFVGDEAGDVPG